MEKKEVELPGDIIVSTRRAAKVEAEIQRNKGHFITGKLDEKRRELGVKEFKKQRDKLAKAFEQDWEQQQKAKAALRSLEDRMNREIMEWAPLEKLYRLKLEAEGWPKTVIEKTLLARRGDFDRSQRAVKNRLRPKVDPDQDFKKRVLNPATRKEALRHYLQDHVNKSHFTLEAFELLWSEVDKLGKRR